MYSCNVFSSGLSIFIMTNYYCTQLVRKRFYLDFWSILWFGIFQHKHSLKVKQGYFIFVWTLPSSTPKEPPRYRRVSVQNVRRCRYIIYVCVWVTSSAGHQSSMVFRTLSSLHLSHTPSITFRHLSSRLSHNCWKWSHPCVINKSRFQLHP